MTGDRPENSVSKTNTSTEAAAKAQKELATGPETDPQELTAPQADPMLPDETVDQARARQEAAREE